MSELCATPKAKGDTLLDADHVAVAVGANGGQSAPNPTPKSAPGMSMGTVAWLTFTTMMAIAGLIMAAWATWKVKDIDRPPSVSLVDNPNNANSVLSYLYRGTGYWTTRAQMAFARSDHGAVAYNGNIYVFGGQSFNAGLNSSEVLRSMSKYNMFLNSVETMPNMPEPRYRFGYAVLKDKLYVFGGWRDLEDYGENKNLAAQTMVFDFKTNKWDALSARSPRMNFPRTDIVGAAANGMVYAIGGYDPNNPNYNSLVDVEIMDPATGEWKVGPNMTIPRGDHAAVAINDTIYVLGGITTVGKGDCDKWFPCHPWVASMEALDAKTGKWSTRANMTYARGDFSVEALSNGHILAAGGENGYGASGYAIDNQVAQPWVEEYFPETNSWVLKAPLSEPRFRFDMASDDGNFIYAFGGAPACPGADSDTCNKKALSTVLGYFDDKYPNVWVAKP